MSDITLGADQAPFQTPVANANAAAFGVSAVTPFADRSGFQGTDLIGEDSANLNPVSGGFIDPLFNWLVNDGTNFRSVFGYQLVITNKGNYVNHIYLPIAPQNIAMNVPVASNIQVTMKGVTEDNNAAPLRTITISGTTGMWHTNAPSGNANSSSSSIINYAFQNTIQAVNNVASQASKLAATFDGSASLNDGALNYPTLSTTNDIPNSGYYFFHNLVRFLDYYITNKKTRAGKDLRLTFQMHKDEMYYDVLLNNYSWRKEPGTLEYQYSIAMTAYRRRARDIISDPSTGSPSNTVQQASSLNTLANVLNSLTQARALVSTASSVLQGINSDANNLFFTPLREAILLGKSLVNVATTLADFPQAIVNASKQAFNQIIQSTLGSDNTIAQQVNTILANTYGIRASPTTLAGFSAQAAQMVVQQQDGLSQLAQRPETASPYEVIFQNTVMYAPVFDLVPTSSLSVPASVMAAYTAETQRVNQLTIPELQQRRAMIQNFAAQVDGAFGGGDATYNTLLGLPPPPVVYRQLTVDDIDLINNINDVLMSYDKLINILINLAPTPDTEYFAFYQDFAVANGLAFQQSASKFFVPFPYDCTLEQLALRYLGDPTRWMEIAALNGLKEPYIDESGFTRSIMFNAAESSVVVSDISDYYVGAVVQVQSNTQPAVPQQIQSMQQVTIGQYLITFAPGGASLIGYLVSDNANILAYLPDTINSSKLVAIPSTNPVNISGKIKLTPDYADLNNLGVLAKVDFLLQTDGQLALTGNGDVVLATGMANLVQAATMRMLTPLGALLNDQTYGNPIQAGTPVSQIDVQDYLKTLNRQFQRDPRFKGVLAGTATLSGPTSVINLLLGVSGTQLALPLTTQVPP